MQSQLGDHFIQQNLNALKVYNKQLAQKLESTTLKNYHIFQGDDNIAIDIMDKLNSDTIYIDPVKETEDRLQEIEKESALHPIMYFFGLGNGVIFKALLNNQYHERIVVFEPELEIIKIALSVVDFSKELSSMKLIIIKSSDFTYGQAFELAMNKTFKVYAKLYNIQIVSDYYLRNYGQEVQDINKTMAKAIKQMVYSHGNDATDSLTGIKHHLANLPEMIKSYTYLGFVNKKNADTAIVVSTGPSLDKQLPLLKKIQNNVTIISPDASLSLLQEHGIKPDIVVSLERTEIVASLIENVDKSFQKDIIFLLASVLHPRSIKVTKGRKIICMRPFGYTFYFDELKEWGYHGIGMSVSNMAHELAFIMKYKKVVLIGQDLSYGSDGQSHSVGNVYGANQRKQSEHDEYILAYGGKGRVKSFTGWILFKNYFEKSIEETQDKMTTYNATEGGARINGAVEIKFVDFVKEFVEKSFQKEQIKLDKVKKEHSKKMLTRALKYVDDWIKFSQDTKDGVQEVFIEVASMCEKIEEAKENNTIDKLDMDEVLKLSDKINEKKELFQDATFSQLFFDVLQSYIIHQEFDLAYLIVSHPTTEEERVKKLLDWILAHKYWLFSLAGGINSILEVVEQSREPIEKALKGEY